MGSSGAAFAHRVVRNVVRRKFRTLGVAFIVGLMLGIFLILSTISTGIEANIAAAEAAVANIVTVEEPTSGGGGGFGGAFGATTPLPESIVPTVEKTTDVESVERILMRTVLPAGCSSGSGGSGGFSCFRNSTSYQGVDTNATTGVQLFGGFGGGSQISIVSGRNLQASDEDSDVAIVGQTYATTNNLHVPQLFSVNGSEFNLVGIFSTGSMFGGNSIVMPFPAAAAALAISGPDLLYVTVDGASNVPMVEGLLDSELDNAYEVSALSNFAGGGFTSSVDNVVSSAQLEGYVALAVGAGVMVLVMVLIFSGRTREVGLLKAFGFSNSVIFSQLVAESLVWAAIGLPIGLVVNIWLGPTIADDLATSAAQSAFGGSGGGHFGGGNFASGFADRLVGQLSWSITPETLAIGIAVTLLFGLAGAAYPVIRALRLQPSEALRNE